MRKLVISEKNNAAMRIATILSNGKARRKNHGGVQVFEFEGPDAIYFVLGLRGHVISLDYPKEYNDWESTPLKELIAVEPVKYVDPSAAKLFAAIRKIAQDVDEIIIATDYDREGELIGVESLHELDWKKTVTRAKFSALTKSEILNAFEKPGEVDYKLASAAETRQIVDLKWGAVLTRFLSMASGQVGKDFLSVGRVQSPTLALIVDREREIETFVPKLFWEIFADLSKSDSEAVFTAAHAHGRFDEQKEANGIFDRIKSAKTGKVLEYTVTQKEEYPPIPFNTTQFLAEANKLGMSASAAMKTAEDLYTDGYISYPRTDNTVYPNSLNLRTLLKNMEGTEFWSYAQEILERESIRPSRGRVTTTDHPPIYPTAGAKKGELKGNQWKIYELVTRRFLATVSPNAKLEEQKADIEIKGEHFNGRGRKLLEAGWRKIYIYWRFDDKDLPPLEKDEKLDVKKIHIKEDQTRPPARFSQGMLIQEMERLGLGTKSTRHEIIQKLFDRKFVHGLRMQPTPIGRAVIVALEDHAKEITDEKMTSHLEQDMDMIAKGEQEQKDVIEESQAMLEDVYAILEKNRELIAADIKTALNKQKYLGTCPKCGKGQMTIIRMQGGKRFIGCSNYPECRTAFPVPAMGHIEPTGEVCKECNSPTVKAPERGASAANICINPNCPTRKQASDVGKCPNCDKRLRVVFSARGKRFIGCEGYPACKTTFPLPQRGGLITTGEQCQACGAPIVKIVSKGKRPWVFCVNMNCSAKEAKKESPAKEAEDEKKKD
jgi:DNA topoisomerase-1